MCARVVAACREATKKPLITKLSPNQTDIRENARLCIEAGSDGLAVINTITGMAIDVTRAAPVIGNVQGGLSGPAIKPIALLKVKQVYEVARPHRMPIIGQGGIANATDALEFLIAGATAVGVGTALFYDPLVLPKINPGIAAYLRAAGTRPRSLRSPARCPPAPPAIAAAPSPLLRVAREWPARRIGDADLAARELVQQPQQDRAAAHP